MQSTLWVLLLQGPFLVLEEFLSPCSQAQVSLCSLKQAVKCGRNYEVPETMALWLIYWPGILKVQFQFPLLLQASYMTLSNLFSKLFDIYVSDYKMLMLSLP